VAPQRGKFVEESGVPLALTRVYGRAPSATRAVGSVPRHYGPTVPRLGALGMQGREALLTVDGATDGNVLRAFVTQVLGPTLEAGEVVVMDNLGAQKVAGIREAMEGCGARVVYLPPYSPDLSPLARCWSKLKTILRRVGARTREALEAAITQALEQITAADALAWFTHCGYEVN
jgi:transposase